MSDIDKDGNAFAASSEHYFQKGMTLRDYFAAAVMQGLYANGYYNETTFYRASEIAYNQADSMILKRNEE